MVETSDDVVTSETTWVFTAGGSCERTVVSRSLAAGFSDTTRQGCTYELSGDRLTITFAGTGGTATFTARVSGDSLFLDGVEFRRVTGG